MNEVLHRNIDRLEIGMVTLFMWDHRYDIVGLFENM